MGEDGLGSDGGYCFGASDDMWSDAMWSDDMWSVFVICSFVTCFVGVVVVIIWSDDMWSADVASALVAASSASATLAKATALRTTHTAVAAGIRMFSLDFIERTFLGCGRGAGIGARPRIAAVIAANGWRGLAVGETALFCHGLSVGGLRFAAARIGPAPEAWTRIAVAKPESSAVRLNRSACPLQSPNRTSSRTMFLCGRVLPAFSP